MRRKTILGLLLIIALLTSTLGCISTSQQTSTETKTSPIPENTGSFGIQVYRDWYHNSTKYFEIYYPKEVRDDPILQSKLNILLLGADSVYESYSKLFGTRPQKAKIYLYPSEKALENITGRKVLWFVNYKKKEIHVALINETGVYSILDVDSALLEYAAGKKLPDIIAVGFGALDAGRTPVGPHEKMEKYVGLNKLKSLNLRGGYNAVLFAEANDLMEYIADEYGPLALVKVLKTGGIPEINWSDFMKFATALEGTAGIGVTTIDMNISLERRKFDAVVDYDNITSQSYVYFWRMPRLKVEDINVDNRSVGFVQGFTLVIPLRDFKNGSVGIKYIGDYSTMKKIAPQRGYIEGQITEDMAFLKMEFLRPMLNSLELFHVITVRVKTDKGTVIGPGGRDRPGSMENHVSARL
ncbi:hypothetical protein [Thermococcus sp.]|uniref:hypothetical protein n=1 Tax=Thermococcus sp. TaxID=35749 RepID=UPI00260D3BAA|nr:hypothetical protein [Thermococcus sp.]